MIRMAMRSIRDGMILGKPVHDLHGRMLLGRGVILSTSMVKRIEAMGIMGLFIQDGNTDDVIAHDNISEMLRGSIILHLGSIFDSMEELYRELKSDSLDAVRKAVKTDHFRDTFRSLPGTQALQQDITNMVAELIRGDKTLGLSSIKTLDTYTFQHSIDVAVVATLIGRRLGLDSKRLHDIGLGGLLHDIGKLFLPKTILDKPGALTDEEFHYMRYHPILGYELIKDTPSVGLLPPHIALQHHEKQDGTGYPRGIPGPKDIGFTLAPRIIHLYGSIAAVADVYDALASDRPYRNAHPTEASLGIIRGMTPHHLHPSVVRAFLTIAPPYQEGTTVRIQNGKYMNWIGVVTKFTWEQMDRPFIRLLYDSARNQVEPVEFDLREHDDMQIESIVL